MTFFSGYRNDGSYISNVLTTLLLVYLYYLSRWSVFQRTLILPQSELQGTVLELPRRPFSRLRVQRYGDFSEHANVFATFLKENHQNIDECQTTENASRANIFYIIIKGGLQICPTCLAEKNTGDNNGCNHGGEVSCKTTG